MCIRDRTYTPHVDGGDHVIIINCADAVLTGNKLQNKKYYRHTGYVGHLKEVGYDRLMAEKPEFAMQLAVKGMIPSTHNGREQLTRLRVYAVSYTHLDVYKRQRQLPLSLKIKLWRYRVKCRRWILAKYL